MKILHCIGSYGLGGQERTLLNLLKLQNSTKKISDVFVLKEEGPLKRQFGEVASCLSFKVQYKDLLSSYRKLFYIINLINEEKYDIVQFYHYSTISKLWLFLKLFTNVKISYFIGSQGHNKTLLQKYHIKVITQFIHLIIVNSKSICKSFKIDERSPKLFLLQNILPLELFEKIKNDKINYQKKDFIIGIVGRLDPVKRHDVFIKIAEKILTVNKDVNFFIYGNGPMLKTIKQDIKNTLSPEKFYLYTNESNINEIYKNFDIFLLTSDSEGFSNAIMEAMLFGIPCVVTKVGGNPDIIMHNENGLLFPRGDSQISAKLILELIKNKKQYAKISTNAFKFVRENYNPSVISNNLISKYKTITNSIKSDN